MKPSAAILALLLLAPRFAVASPHLVFDPLVTDLGIIEGDRVVPYSLSLRNEGDETLRITHVSTTCGCTVAVLPDSTITPGGAVPLKGSLDTRKMEGEIRKSIFIINNDPGRERAVLILHGFVVRTVSHSPTALFFSNARLNRSLTKSITIRSGSGVPLEITGVSSATGLFRFDVTPLEEKDDYRIDAVLLPSEERRTIRDTIRIATTIEGYEEIDVPVLGQIR